MLIKIKKFILIAFLGTIFNQEIVGEYRVTGLSLVNSDFCRQNTDIVVREKSGFDLTDRIAYTISQGELLDYSGSSYLNYPLPLLVFQVGMDLRVYFANDGTATILQGSSYPTESAGEGCITTPGVNPIQEDFTYVIDSQSNEYIPVIDILGFESLSPYKGLPATSISITGSDIFDVVPITPTQLTIPFDIDITADTLNTLNNLAFNDNEIGIISANTILPGRTSGYVIKDTEMYSYIDCTPESGIPCYNTDQGYPPLRPSLYLEWHALDGTINQSGLGDLVGEDEDGDGTDFDTIFGLEKIKITKVNSTDDCGLNSYDIVGDHVEDLRTVKYNQCLNEGTSESTCLNVADNWIETCVDFEDIDDVGNYLYVMDLNQDPNYNWGGYITWNSLLYNSTQNEIYLIDDSNENFNSTCMSDDDFSDCSGRIIFEYTPQCIPSFNTRYFMAELQEQCQEVDKDECGVCFGNGIPDGYCDCYLGYRDCNGNCDEDPSNDDLSCFGCDGKAYFNNNIPPEYDECGLCGGEGKSTYCFDSDGNGIGDENISIEYCPYEVPNDLWVLECSSSSLNNDIDTTPNNITILKTYPNPFNPNLNIEFKLNNWSNIEIKIYDINGRLISKLVDGYYNIGKHQISWDAKSFASGIYFIELKSDYKIITNRVELLK